MSSIYRLRITAGPSESAASMADLSTDTVWVLGDSLDLGEPDVTFDRAGFPVEGERRVSMSVHVKGTGADAGIVMQQIARAISVPDRWLMVQREVSTDPVWYRLWPQSPGSLDMSRAWVDAKGGYWTWDLSLTTDSTAVGERRIVPRHGSGEVTSTITNEGTSGGTVLDVPGEAPTPLRISALPSEAVNGTRTLVSTFSVPWDSPLIDGGSPTTVVEDTDFGDWGVGTTRTTGAAFLSGGTGITAGLTDTFRRSWAGGAPVSGLLEPGRYLVMARIYRQGAGGQLKVRLAQRWGGINSWQRWYDWRPTDGGDRSSWLPIGYLDHPFGHSGEGLDPADIVAPTIHIQRETTVTHPSAQVHLDQVAFVPVDLARGTNEAAMFCQYEPGVGASGPQGLSWRWDAQNRSTHSVFGAEQVHAAPSPLRTGGWPVGTPGMATCVSIFFDTSDAPASVDAVARTAGVTVECAPRQLHLGQER